MFADCIDCHDPLDLKRIGVGGRDTALEELSEPEPESEPDEIEEIPSSLF